MLGRFLELSLPTPDIEASFNFYLKLGFSNVEVGETWPHPYAVVTDGRICLGLHRNDSPAPVLTFVRPQLLRHVETLEAAGVQLESRCLGNDVFNEVAWLAPSGCRLRLIEARTFSPSKRTSQQVSLCGYFLEIGLPCIDLELEKLYWEKFGFVGIEEFDARLPHIACTSDYLDVGLYEMQALRGPTLRFEVDDVQASMERLAELGIARSQTAPQTMRGAAAGLIVAPEGTPLLLTASG